MHDVGLVAFALLLAINTAWQISQKRYIPRPMTLRTASLACIMLLLNITYAIRPSLPLLLISMFPMAAVIVSLGAGMRAYIRNGGSHRADATKARLRALMHERRQMLEKRPGS